MQSKTLTIMGTIITTATIMAFYLNSASNIESPYYYNADIDNGQVKTMYVFDRQGESLIGKAEYRYEYDAEGRVTVKEVYSRSAATGRMMPRSRYEYTYTDDGYSLAHRMWNPDKQAFGKADSRHGDRRGYGSDQLRTSGGKFSNDTGQQHSRHSALRQGFACRLLVYKSTLTIIKTTIK